MRACLRVLARALARVLAKNELPRAQAVVVRIRKHGHAEAFADTLRSMRPTYLRKADRELKEAFDQLADDFLEVVASDAVVAHRAAAAALFDTNKLLFSKTMPFLTKSTESLTPLFAPAALPEEDADREQARIDRSRLLSVVARQKERWAARALSV